MHACGHDLHTAGLVGAARLLAARRAELAGDVVFMFQPGEEGWDGAGHMIAEGVLDAAGRRPTRRTACTSSRRCIAARRVRVPAGPADGRVRRAVRDGDRRRRPRLAPARAARPDPGGVRDGHRAADDGDAPASTRSSRSCITVGLFHAGTKRNIIPDEATFEATIRTFNPEVARAGREICGGGLRGHRRRARADVSRRATSGEYPVTVNDAAEYEFVAATRRARSSARSGSPRCRIRSPARRTSRECSERVPGAYMFLGACVDGRSGRRRRPTTRRARPSTTACWATGRRCSPSWPCAGSPVRRRNDSPVGGRRGPAVRPAVAAGPRRARSAAGAGSGRIRCGRLVGCGTIRVWSPMRRIQTRSR